MDSFFRLLFSMSDQLLALVGRTGASWLIPLIGLFLTYLIGSIPFGLLIAKLFGLGDLRAIGSGSTGATNVVRAGGKLPGALTLLLDAGKAVLGLFVALGFVGIVDHMDMQGWRGLIPFFGPMLGHCYSPWLRFNGGKGVAVLIGCYIALDLSIAMPSLLPDPYSQPFFTAFYLISWILLFKTTRISSVGGMGAALLTLGAVGIFYLMGKTDAEILVFFAILTLFVLWRHRANIGRLLRGEEHRFPVKAA